MRSANVTNFSVKRRTGVQTEPDVRKVSTQSASFEAFVECNKRVPLADARPRQAPPPQHTTSEVVDRRRGTLLHARNPIKDNPPR